jgi:hypothetical protein
MRHLDTGPAFAERWRVDENAWHARRTQRNATRGKRKPHSRVGEDVHWNATTFPRASKRFVDKREVLLSVGRTAARVHLVRHNRASANACGGSSAVLANGPDGASDGSGHRNPNGRSEDDGWVKPRRRHCEPDSDLLHGEVVVQRRLAVPHQTALVSFFATTHVWGGVFRGGGHSNFQTFSFLLWADSITRVKLGGPSLIK